MHTHTRHIDGLYQREANHKWVRTKCSNLKITTAQNCTVSEVILSRDLNDAQKKEKIHAMSKWISDTFNMKTIEGAC